MMGEGIQHEDTKDTKKNLTYQFPFFFVVFVSGLLCQVGTTLLCSIFDDNIQHGWQDESS